jgi:hypothetical protein
VHYLKEQGFTNHAGNEEEKVSRALSAFGGAYAPLRDYTLATAALRNLNRALDVLEGDPSAEGYYAFEDAHWKVLKETVIKMMENSSMARSAPIIEDILNGASTEKPIPINRDKIAQLREGPPVVAGD